MPHAPTTADELLLLDEPGCRVELVRGELRRTSCDGWWHGAVAARVCGRLHAHVRHHRLGIVLAAGTGFLLARDPDTVRSPDAAFVRAERVPAQSGRGYLEGAPDLVVEITSPDDTWEHVLEKAQCWLDHGAATVWVIEAETRRSCVFHPGGTITVLQSGGTLRGEPALPGFSIAVADLFPNG